MLGNQSYNVQKYSLWGNDDWWYSAIGTYSGPGEMMDVYSKVDRCESGGCGGRRWNTVEGFDGISDALVDEFQVDYNAPQANTGKTTTPTPKPTTTKNVGSGSGSARGERTLVDEHREERRNGRRTRGYPSGGYGYEYNDYNDYIAPDPYFVPVPVEVPVPVYDNDERGFGFDMFHLGGGLIAFILLMMIIIKYVFLNKK